MTPADLLREKLCTPICLTAHSRRKRCRCSCLGTFHGYGLLREDGVRQTYTIGRVSTFADTLFPGATKKGVQSMYAPWKGVRDSPGTHSPSTAGDRG